VLDDPGRACSPLLQPTSVANQTRWSTSAIRISSALGTTAGAPLGAPRSAAAISRAITVWNPATFWVSSGSPVAIARTSARARLGRRQSARVVL
jgi:hypothetical protein